MWIGHPDLSVDLCIMPIAQLLRSSQERGQQLFFIPMGSNLLPSADDLLKLTAVEEVVMIGYPDGIWDSVNNMPIFRRGVTATHPNIDYCGKKEFMIDAACFPIQRFTSIVVQRGSLFRPSRKHNYWKQNSNAGRNLHGGAQHSVTGEISIENIPTVSKPVAVSGIPNNLGVVIKAERLREFDAVLEKLLGSKSPA